MTTASQILERKGYELDEINDIVSANGDSFDIQTRKYFEIYEPVHLWERYYIGDADEEVLLQVANNNGYEDITELLSAMDRYLLSLAETYKEK